MRPRPRIYVAAPRQEVRRARELARHLVEAGAYITSSWLGRYVDGEDDPHPRSEVARLLAKEQRQEIWHSELLVALTAEGVGRQTYTEIGTAIEMGIDVIWSAERGGLALVASCPCVYLVETDVEALELALAGVQP